MKVIFQVLLVLFLLPFYAFYSGDKHKKDSLEVILVGDTQRTSNWELFREKNKGIAKRIFNEIVKENPDFVIHLGDMVFNGSSEKSWNNFEEDASKLLNSQIPVYPVLGNHEYFGENNTAISNLAEHFPSLKNETWYSHKIDKLGIILLNSNFNDLTSEQNSHQLKWYYNELNKFQTDSSVQFILVACHHPPYTNSIIVSANKEVQKNFVEPFLSISKAAFFFSGHAHTYEHFIKNGKHFIVSGGGGGPRQKLNKNSPKYNDLYKGDNIRDFNFCKITSNEKVIKLQMIHLDKSGRFSIGDSIIVSTK